MLQLELGRADVEEVPVQTVVWVTKAPTWLSWAPSPLVSVFHSGLWRLGLNTLLPSSGSVELLADERPLLLGSELSGLSWHCSPLSAPHPVQCCTGG